MGRKLFLKVRHGIQKNNLYEKSQNRFLINNFVFLSIPAAKVTEVAVAAGFCFIGGTERDIGIEYLFN